jgi:hypothetical protein
MIEILPGIYYKEDGTAWTTNTTQDHYGRTEPRQITAKNNYGYLKIGRKDKTLYWHRLVYEHFNGPIPDGMKIDHIDNDPSNNRIENLRLVTHKSNVRKVKKHRNNTSGFPGVIEQNGRITARICVDGKGIYIGDFNTKEEAYAAYLEKKVLLHGIDSVSPIINN